MSFHQAFYTMPQPPIQQVPSVVELDFETQNYLSTNNQLFFDDSMDYIWSSDLQMDFENHKSYRFAPQFQLQTTLQQAFPRTLALRMSPHQSFDTSTQSQVSMENGISSDQIMDCAYCPVRQMDVEMPPNENRHAALRPKELNSGHKRSTLADWERLKPQIKRLYVDEDKTLKEVMRMMAAHHDHHGTAKMYKSRIKKWKLDKNNKEDDMVFLLHKIADRRAVGKESLFRVRDQVVNAEEVFRYFRRKKRVPQSARIGARMPPHISCRTPSPVPMAILPPSQFLNVEELFSSIIIYFRGSFSSGIWTDDRDGWIVPIQRVYMGTNLTMHFKDHCQNAVDLFLAGSAVQGRRVLSHACNLVRHILINQEPDGLQSVLIVLVDFIRNDFGDVAIFMLNYIGMMATEIFARGDPEHPLGKIYALLKGCDLDLLNSTVVRTFECVYDRFEQHSGRFHEMTAYFYCEFVSVSCGGDMVKRECLYRARLLECKNAVDRLSYQVQSLMLDIGYVLYVQGRYSESVDMAMETLNRAREVHDVIIISSALELLARVHLQYGKIELAEKTLREAVQLYNDEFQETHPMAIRYLILLGRWLEAWGKKQEADDLMIEIDRCVGRDDVDRELESQGYIL